MSAPKWKLGDAKITSRTSLETSDAKWVGLEAIHWTDEEGRERKWESANRKTRKGGIDAVSIFPLIKAPSKPLSTVLVMQYRPPVDCVCVELPAGLIDEGESPEQAAVRELKEETGYQNAQIINASSVLVADPGMSAANLSLVTLMVNVKDDEAEPNQELDAGEHIVKKLIPIKDLYEFCLEHSKKKGYVVDARLYHLAAGLDFAAKNGL